ncbi:MAG: hypothetical protein N3G21_05605 [Candidatus Hydrogenedentes bacterium]|nr:hypothetical protein [Candidatus Hydrogenedentota bacterium]
MGAEIDRLRDLSEGAVDWRKWGPYLPERLWGTVRECFANNQDAWHYTTFETAHQRNYLTGDDGIFGWSDSSGSLCFSFAFWNAKDPILKERFFGLGGTEGIHGEDVKELYFYLDAVPSYSYARAMYRYPCDEFPYGLIKEENYKLMIFDPEFEIVHSNIFDRENFFDIFVEIAKNTPSDIIIRITGFNRSSEPKPLHIIPQFWYRNTWIWASLLERFERKPSIHKAGPSQIVFSHPKLGEYRLEIVSTTPSVIPQFLFSENDAYPENLQKFLNLPRSRRDAFTQAVVHNNSEFLSDRDKGTKVGVWFNFSISPHSSAVVTLRLSSIQELPSNPPIEDSDNILMCRKLECEDFYERILPTELKSEYKNLLKQTYAGLLWTRILYNLNIEEWLKILHKVAPNIVNENFEKWRNFKANHIIAVPDKWEYPWFASWDLPFILIPTAKIDPQFAIEQIELFLSNKYQSPAGQIPSSEWNFSSITPPVIPWGINKILEKIQTSTVETKQHLLNSFLKNIFCSIYTYLIGWLNQKDSKGRSILEDGLIGLDNLQIIDRYIENRLISEDSQALFWTPFLISNVVELAFNLIGELPLLEPLIIRLLHILKQSILLLQSQGRYKYWNEEEGFFYPIIRVEDKEFQLHIKNFTSLMPIFGITLVPKNLSHDIEKCIEELFVNDKSFAKFVKLIQNPLTNKDTYVLLSVNESQIQKVLSHALNESEFLSNFGIRSLSRLHRKNPLYISTPHTHYEIIYCPGELESRMFGGNTNWYGPIWLSLNYIFIDYLEKLHLCFPDYRFEEDSNEPLKGKNFHEIAQEIRKRIIDLFTPNAHGIIPSLSSWNRFRGQKLWQDLYLFYEYFNGDTGEGVGASHQTGWTALIAEIVLEFLKG